ncbi:MAG: hypothetical protein WDO70_05640 [Alphaproteobacteria bacterium]
MSDKNAPPKTSAKGNMAALMGCIESIWRDPAKTARDMLHHQSLEDMGHKLEALVIPSTLNRNSGNNDYKEVARKLAREKKAGLLQDMRSGNPHNRQVWSELAEINKILDLPSTHTGH